MKNVYGVSNPVEDNGLFVYGFSFIGTRRLNLYEKRSRYMLKRACIEENMRYRKRKRFVLLTYLRHMFGAMNWLRNSMNTILGEIRLKRSNLQETFKLIFDRFRLFRHLRKRTSSLWLTVKSLYSIPKVHKMKMRLKAKHIIRWNRTAYVVSKEMFCASLLEKSFKWNTFNMQLMMSCFLLKHTKTLRVIRMIEGIQKSRRTRIVGSIHNQ